MCFHLFVQVSARGVRVFVSFVGRGGVAMFEMVLSPSSGGVQETAGYWSLECEG